MKRYFNNPEIKRSSIIFLLIMAVFLTCNYFMIKAHNEKLKSDYIKALGSVTAKIVESDPKFEKEIVPLLTREVSKEQERKGREILRQYGLSEKLDISLFPYIKGNFKSMELSIFSAGIILTMLLFILNYFQHGYFYENMRNFSSAAKKIVEGDYNLKLSEEKEGDLSKLTKSFNSMGEVIRGNLFTLNKEKRFLVELLSDISHQLKTPLSTMILYNDILLNKDLTKEQQNTFLKNNENQLNRMSWLILNLLKLAKIDANAIELEMEEQSLNETIEETVEILESKAMEAKVKVEFIPKDTVILKHDRLWMQEALSNVVKNGIEHACQGGKVNINIEDNPIYTRIIIKNTGEPISEEDLPHVFKRFYKSKKSKKSDSIGIGLSLAKSVVERHGGYIEVISKEQDGTSFIITFLKY
ncbi:HAMP domain-containing sensor histidine kinase [Clostridium sp. HMP27]|uniref:HAMP domain-containing sensor histidine kinase n=1 Tax=Clostridium sp. HMP27 TaxID=1487921 RepID=UPI00052CC13A|nr:HAMP domain-containing sensor histidine kinase [Clostridium sp. HMP27]KGK84223.1 histidine kinase [Clostridium sp. HMP27]